MATPSILATTPGCPSRCWATSTFTIAHLVLERARGAAVMLTSKVKLDAAKLRALPNLRYVPVLATGYDNVDVAAAAQDPA